MDRNVPPEAEQRIDLSGDDQDGAGILEPGHDRRGNVADEASQPQDADQGLEEPRGQDDEEHEGERALGISARRHGRRSAGHTFDHHGGHHQRDHASRRVHEAGRAAQEEAGEEHDNGAQQTGEDTVGDEAVAERLEGEKPIADTQRNGQDSCADTPSQVTRGARSHEYDASPSLSGDSRRSHSRRTGCSDRRRY